jgi:hypothetical protein
MAYFTMGIPSIYYPDALAAWDGSTVQVRKLDDAASNATDWAPLTFDGSGQPLVISTDGLFHLTPPISTSSPYSRSSFEASSLSYSLFDVAFAAGKPYIAVRHGTELELVVPDARGYWTYTHLGNADSSTQIGVAVDRSDMGHACYKLNGKITYQ